MVDKNRPRLMVVEGDTKLETKKAIHLSMEGLLRFAQDVARIENTSMDNSEKRSKPSGLLKIKTADFEALVVSAEPAEQKFSTKMSAKKNER